MDLSIQALKRYSKRSVKMGKLRNAGVLDDMVARMERHGRPLTEGQARYAAAMAMQVSDENWKKYRQWGDELQSNDELREKLEVVSRYYIYAGYHRNTAGDALSYLIGKEGAIPPAFNECQRMLNNDYAKNVWINHKAEPKFSLGDLISLRAGNIPWQARHIECFMIVGIGNQPIKVSHKYNEKLGGTKIYDVMEVGGTKVYHVLEKQLKKHRVPKAKKTK